MGIRTLTLGKKLHIIFIWLPMVFNVKEGNFLCLISRRFVWVNINKNLPKINFTDYITFYEPSLKVGPTNHMKFAIVFAHLYFQVKLLQCFI